MSIPDCIRFNGVLIPTDYMLQSKIHDSILSFDIRAEDDLKTNVTVFWKTNHLHTRTEVHLLPVHDRHTHALFKNTKHKTIARSAFTNGFLLMLLNHEGAFHGPGMHH